MQIFQKPPWHMMSVAERYSWHICRSVDVTWGCSPIWRATQLTWQVQFNSVQQGCQHWTWNSQYTCYIPAHRPCTLGTCSDHHPKHTVNSSTGITPMACQCYSVAPQLVVGDLGWGPLTASAIFTPTTHNRYTAKPNQQVTALNVSNGHVMNGYEKKKL